MHLNTLKNLHEITITTALRFEARIMLFGQSAGAGCVSSHVAMPRSSELFSAAVMQSGGFGGWSAQHMKWFWMQFLVVFYQWIWRLKGKIYTGKQVFFFNHSTLRNNPMFCFCQWCLEMREWSNPYLLIFPLITFSTREFLPWFQHPSVSSSSWKNHLGCHVWLQECTGINTWHNKIVWTLGWFQLDFQFFWVRNSYKLSQLEWWTSSCFESPFFP